MFLFQYKVGRIKLSALRGESYVPMNAIHATAYQRKNRSPAAFMSLDESHVVLDALPDESDARAVVVAEFLLTMTDGTHTQQHTQKRS